ncbi:MAG: WG repeat-containing protein [Saprospiraceae bacterium]|nr:WG repeat-containing protein [Saprospiraceae bacterium]
MKNLLTLFLLFSVVTILSAQNPRIEKFSDYQLVTYTFYKGSGDSVQYKLRDKADTLQTTLYYRNGKAKSMQWRDSFYFFDVKGRLRTREAGLKKQKNSMSDEERKYDETVEYFPNGQYQTIVMKKNGQYIEQRFDEKGKLMRVKLESHTPSVYRERTIVEHGKTRLSRKIDTLIQNGKSIINFYDTVFYNNGNIYAVSLMQKLDDGYMDVLSKKYYNLNGKLVASELPDSVKLKSFKDNIDCYYGLKNRQGDTIWAAQFDHIEFEDKPAFIKAFVGNRCTLLHLDGSPVRMSINNLSDWDVIYNETKENYILIDTYDYVNSDKELDDLLALERNVLFRFTTTDGQFGVMNGEMEMVIPPQYIYPLSSMNRGNWFSFRTNKQNNTVRIGCMDKTGTPIFPDTFKYVTYSGFEDYFILSCEFKESSRSMKENYRPILAGLGKGSNQTVVIEPRFDDIELLQQPSLFLVTLKRGNKDNDSDRINGLYNPVAKQWLLEAKDYSIQDSRSESRNVYFVLKNVNTQKYCIMDTNGKYIVKPSMPLDSIGIIDAENGSFWVKKKDKFYFLDIKNGQAFLRPKAYDYLYKIEFGTFVNSVMEVSKNFLAKYKGKWGLMEANENSIIPFEYEYVSTNFFDSGYGDVFFMVKNNGTIYFVVHRN